MPRTPSTEVEDKSFFVVISRNTDITSSGQC